MHGFACGPVRRIGGMVVSLFSDCSMVVSFFWDLGSTAWLFFLFFRFAFLFLFDLISFFSVGDGFVRGSDGWRSD
jgi:hypothetical protein